MTCEYCHGAGTLITYVGGPKSPTARKLLCPYCQGDQIIVQLTHERDDARKAASEWAVTHEKMVAVYGKERDRLLKELDCARASHAGQQANTEAFYDDCKKLEAEVERLTLERDDSREEALFLPSQLCRQSHVQRCHVCDDLTCGDNLRPDKAEVARLTEERDEAIQERADNYKRNVEFMRERDAARRVGDEYYRELKTATALLGRLIDAAEWVRNMVDQRLGPRDDSNSRDRDGLVRLDAALDAARRLLK